MKKAKKIEYLGPKIQRPVTCFNCIYFGRRNSSWSSGKKANGYCFLLAPEEELPTFNYHYSFSEIEIEQLNSLVYELVDKEGMDIEKLKLLIWSDKFDEFMKANMSNYSFAKAANTKEEIYNSWKIIFKIGFRFTNRNDYCESHVKGKRSQK